MKLYYKRTGWGGEGSYLCIADIDGNKRYDLRRSDRLAKRIIIRDNDKNDVAMVKQVLKSLLPRYQIIIGDEVVLEVKKEFQPLIPKYTLSGSLGWEINSLPIKHLFEATRDGVMMMRSNGTQDVQWWPHVAHYEIEYPGAAEELPAVALSVAINMAIEGEKFMKTREEIREMQKKE